ncbi:MAG TPA: hypothetical protein VGI61_12610 [Parafilimonas sp.]|jgi:uncharacterized membrane protein
MLNRLTQLSFTIGLFFTVVSVILLIGYFISDALSSTLNMYAGITFLVFGLLMMLIKGKAEGR